MIQRIIYLRRFNKQLAKLQKYQQLQIADVIVLFGKNPFDPVLKNHKLKGDMKGRRSISAGFDLRIIYEERDGHTVVIMIAVGTHEEIY